MTRKCGVLESNTKSVNGPIRCEHGMSKALLVRFRHGCCSTTETGQSKGNFEGVSTKCAYTGNGQNQVRREDLVDVHNSLSFLICLTNQHPF